jgi:hypothetical protein
MAEFHPIIASISGPRDDRPRKVGGSILILKRMTRRHVVRRSPHHPMPAQRIPRGLKLRLPPGPKEQVIGLAAGLGLAAIRRLRVAFCEIGAS